MSIAKIFGKKTAIEASASPIVPRITLSFEKHYVEINGITFELLKSDADIIEDALKLLDESDTINAKDKKSVLQSFHNMAAYIDTVLGDGALQQIAGGVRVGYLDIKKSLSAIVDAVYTTYQTQVALKYGE